MREPEESPDYRMRSVNKSSVGITRNRVADYEIEALSYQSMQSRGPLTRGDGDASSSLNEKASRDHSRANWRQRVSQDGRPDGKF